jgi:hypothetical protein
VTPTARSLKHLREQGLTADVVERFNSFTRKRHDLFGIIDLIAVGDDGIIGIQATSRSNVSARIAKAKAEERLKVWLKAGGKFSVFGWGKTGAKGKRKTYTLRQVDLTLDDLNNEGER